MKHEICSQEIILDNTDLSELLKDAQSNEENGQFYLAALKYRELAENLDKNSKNQLIAQSRSAHSFEISNQYQDAARMYHKAGGIAISVNMNHNFRIAGELFNRAGFNYKMISDFMNASTAYISAGEVLQKHQEDNIHTQDNIPPIPAKARKHTVAAYCYAEAAKTLEKINDNRESTNYWQAGNMCVKDGASSGYWAYIYYKKALISEIKYNFSIEGDEARRRLFMSEEQRKQRIEPIEIIEEQIANYYRYENLNKHEKFGISNEKHYVEDRVDKNMISMFYEFYRVFMQSGNKNDASRFYARLMRRKLRQYLKNRKFFNWISLGFIGLTSGFGEKIKNWFISCILILFAFAFIFYLTDSIKPSNRVMLEIYDYLYFSIVTFTSLGYGDYHPVGLTGKIFASIEAVSGLIMLGVLLNLIARRISRD